MIKMRLRIITGSIAFIISLFFILLFFSSSLSVSGVIQTRDSSNCASCHYETPFYEGWNRSLHGKSNVACLDCHNSTSITDETCLSCHQNYIQTSNATYLWQWNSFIITIDSHDTLSHIGHVDCKTCHIEHDFKLGKSDMVTETMYLSCHRPYEGPKPSQGSHLSAG